MQLAADASVPVTLIDGQWHLPYVNSRRENIKIIYFTDDNDNISLEDAKQISVSCCAQVSYRKTDDSLEKARALFARLMGSAVKHASPTEHQATPMVYQGNDSNVSGTPAHWEDGVSHMDKQGRLWSGNFRGFIQYRKTITDEAKVG
jgi:hypothetical protein